jgi:gas vesicle protein
MYLQLRLTLSLTGAAAGLFSLVAVVLLPLTGAAQSKDQREKIDRMAAQIEDLKTELVLLQRQTQSMQDTFNKTMGELNTLIVQMSDNISTIRRAQQSVSGNSGDVVTQVTSMGERLTGANERMERLSEQFTQLKKVIEDIPTSTEAPSEKIVLTGTVTAISQVYAQRPSLRNWAVTIRVEKVKEGKFSHPEFTFTVHSPAMAGLEVGRRCTIEATWTGQGYLVDDTRWMRDKDAGR